MAQDFHSDIVFLDVGMPDLSGDDVAIALRRLPTLEHIYDAAVMGWNDAALGTGPSATAVGTAPTLVRHRRGSVF
jgi:CheY-like chemotaxis protein